MYLSWSEKTITNFSEENIRSLYDKGYLFTRAGKGRMCQTRSVRVDLSAFKLSSENRRILKKTEGLVTQAISLPHPNYDWRIHKKGHDFYKKKFGEKTFTANKLKELMTDEKKSNFNLLLEYYFLNLFPNLKNNIGYCICFQTRELIHYCYPFYTLNAKYLMPNTGMAMMLRAAIWAKEREKKHIYLGSAQRPNDTYKLQFEGVEWWDGKEWKKDIAELKNNL